MVFDKRDVLKGAEEIAAFLGEDKRSVFYQISRGNIPHYRIGTAIRARRSTLAAWVARQEDPTDIAQS